jgi:hypothetical protein
LAFDERFAQRPVDLGAAAAEIPIPGRFAGAGEVRDRLDRAVDVRVQVQRSAFSPRVARKDPGGGECQLVGERPSGVRE